MNPSEPVLALTRKEFAAFLDLPGPASSTTLSEVTASAGAIGQRNPCTQHSSWLFPLSRPEFHTVSALASPLPRWSMDCPPWVRPASQACLFPDGG